MDIAAMRVRVTIQKNGTVTDKYGNHKSVWTDYFRCWATAAQSREKDERTGAVTTEENRLNFTVRWCSETAAVDTKHYRILLMDRVYNIVGIDDMNFKRNSRKFIAELSER